jgi:hypothetical protein
VDENSCWTAGPSFSPLVRFVQYRFLWCHDRKRTCCLSFKDYPNTLWHYLSGLCACWKRIPGPQTLGRIWLARGSTAASCLRCPPCGSIIQVYNVKLQKKAKCRLHRMLPIAYVNYSSGKEWASSLSLPMAVGPSLPGTVS